MKQLGHRIVCCLAFVAAGVISAATATAQEDRKPVAWFLKKPPVKVDSLQPLKAYGRPFFPIGAYGLPKDMTMEEVAKEGGWNAVLVHHLVRPAGENTSSIWSGTAGWMKAVPNEHLPTEINNAYAAMLLEAQRQNIAVMVTAQDLILKGKYGQQDALATRLKRVMPFKSFWGFYMVDEPENAWWSYTGELGKKNDLEEYMKEHNLDAGQKMAAMNDVIHDRLAWVRPLFKSIDTRSDNYTFMCIAWQDHYQKLQALCDVNMPNSYPAWYPKGSKKSSPEITGGNLPLVVSDARQAAAAAYVHGNKIGFIWTPLCLDSISGVTDFVPQSVLRYTFFAPITQGAMGVISWAGYRCTREYAQKTVFPVTRQLNALSQFFLGTWLDDKLTWTPTDQDEDLLHEYDTPRVTACLRRAEDGRYLLLATNNSSKPTDAVFVPNLPDIAGMQVHEFINDQPVEMGDNGEIKDSIEAYGVKAYILTPQH